MKKLNDLQKEFISFLPEPINKMDLPLNAKLLLGKLLQVYYSCKQPPFIFVTDREISKDTKIDFKAIGRARTILTIKKLIYPILGTINVATHYIINLDEEGDILAINEELLEEMTKTVEEKKVRFNEKKLYKKTGEFTKT